MIMDNTIVLDKTVDAAQTAVDDSVKFHVNNLELYYKDFHALKASAWIYRKRRSLHLSDRQDVENPHF